MPEKELREKINQEIKRRLDPYGRLHFYSLTDQILALIKEDLPELARENGYIKLADGFNPNTLIKQVKQ